MNRQARKIVGFRLGIGYLFPCLIITPGRTDAASVIPASSRCSSYSPEPIGPAAPEWGPAFPPASLAPRKLGSWRSSRIEPSRRDGWWSAAAARRDGGDFAREGGGRRLDSV